ncbi:hypothetical protein [Burkholderia multivorans]|uniref:hypothetical protein n=1 Tax=Burkholderia multivorans TaxID=87883 RepID=UPI0019D2C210|nr:hypothetical protein [Burkholderia multivorans]MBN6732743.1 hypothetical protein [Burkholderia multivorans]MBN8167049.1 hypothetical protein [Burkholderia multivorans]MBN8172842.1 hypothetical protein [Burkholderia multivorans]MBN8178459.1 hypothetical protein [Burkholderia multivorans]QSL34762.1 hypothetical protein G0D91_27025 [Burkholderia multivorans]
MNGNDLNDKVLLALGTIQGELRGIREMVQHGQQATNQRIDDLKQAVTERIDGLEDRVVKLESDHGKLVAKTAGLGGVAGGAMTALVEIVRYFATKG